MTQPKPFKVLDPAKDYTFRSYYEMKFAPSDILADLGCSLQKAALSLPHSHQDIPLLESLKTQLAETSLLIEFNSEQSRREALIAPVILTIARTLKINTAIEYSIRVSNWLKGDLDYYLKQDSNLLVVEAKNADLVRGFVQLASELIALASWETESAQHLYGAVTTGELWLFGCYDQEAQSIIQDITLYRVPQELTEILQILMGILTLVPIGNDR